MFSKILTDVQLDNLDRVNDFDLDFKSLYVYRKTFEQLPLEIQKKINPDDIYPDNDELDKKLKDDGNYVVKKEGDYWRFTEIVVDRNKLGRPKDSYSLDYYDYLHKYDHVYPIPKSINDFIADKIQKGEVSE